MNTTTKAPFLFNAVPLQLLFFGGKGGVGKTTCSAAAELHYSRSFPQHSFLLVSTDPAHSLTDSMTNLTLPQNLECLELDARQCLFDFMEKHEEKLREIAARGTFLDDEDISQFLNLSLPGLDELMAFLEISRWAEEGKYNGIVVDTAPTGHTLRLLAMPELIRKWLEALDALLAKHRYMKQLFSGTYRKDELDVFLLELSDSVKQMEGLLQDASRCRFVPVMLAETLSTLETASLLDELNRSRMPVTDIVVNRLYPENTCPVCMDRRARQMEELSRLPEKISRYTLWGVPMHPEEIRGPESLTKFWESISPLNIPNSEFRIPKSHEGPHVEMPGTLPSSEMKLLLFAGKGGVGKTTLACATAVRMARAFKGKEVFIFSTDPAHSLSYCLNAPIGPEPTRLSPGLTAMEIDAQAEFESLKDQYAEELEKFLKGISAHLDLTFDREVMERIMDLSPPGLDEVMALTLAMEFFAQDRYDNFILDSAPTGHLIRLLETPELIDQWLKVFFGLFLKYKHIFKLPGISRKLVQISKDLKILRDLLQDPHRSAIFGVAILTEMAFEETKDLVAACARLNVHTQALFLNMATPKSKCSLCNALYSRESGLKKKFKNIFPETSQTLVYQRGEPRGIERLEALGEAMYD